MCIFGMNRFLKSKIPSLKIKKSNELILTKILFGLLFLIFWSCTAPSNDEYAPLLAYQSTIDGHSLHSKEFPKGTISFDQGIEYIGGETFILYEVARCEIHLFGELTGDGAYKRLYWIQYEGYLPKKLLPFPLSLKPSPLRYDYSEDPYRLDIAGRTFYTGNSYHLINRSEEYLNAENGLKDSDFAHVACLLKRNGVNINAEVLGVRMVYLDPSRQKELMVIYYEVIENDQLSIEKLEGEGENSSLWTEVSRDLRNRASHGIQITFAED